MAAAATEVAVEITVLADGISMFLENIMVIKFDGNFQIFVEELFKWVLVVNVLEILRLKMERFLCRKKKTNAGSWSRRRCAFSGINRQIDLLTWKVEMV